MPAKPTPGGIHIKGDVSGTIVQGDGNHVTTHRVDASTPAESRPPHQQNSAEDHGTVYAVTHGTMHITANRYDSQGSQDTEEDESE